MGGFSPSSGLMCEIVNSVGQRNFTFFRKRQRISETSGSVQNDKNNHFWNKRAIKLCLHAVVAANCSFAFLQFEVVTN